MAALLRGLRAGRALRGIGGALVAPTATSPRCRSLSRGFHCAALRLQDESKSDKPPSSSSTNYHEHYQAHPTDQDTTAASQGDSADYLAADEAFKTNTSYQDQSGEQGEEYETEEQLQARILSASLEFVQEHGWSMEAIAAGAETLGLSSASTGMFNNGAGDLVLHFIAQCNLQLTEILAEQHKQVQLGQAEYVCPTFTHACTHTHTVQMYSLNVQYVTSGGNNMSLCLVNLISPEHFDGILSYLSQMLLWWPNKT
ncbi:hypothetical protein JOB18_044602 [Solea senegalensis]|uniref:Ubiquinone biosynthesis protein n=1 Tax=Solea senegalensis TaxID=28829 RepID=A0AAV6T1V0_SOLSE|nr:hypothetical protein JOB18_044602 [Solea senegalensis]